MPKSWYTGSLAVDPTCHIFTTYHRGDKFTIFIKYINKVFLRLFLVDWISQHGCDKTTEEESLSQFSRDKNDASSDGSKEWKRQKWEMIKQKNMNQEKIHRIIVASRITFPCVFLAFNIVYWLVCIYKR